MVTVVLLVSLGTMTSCESGMQAIDRQAEALLRQTSAEMDGAAMPPRTRSDLRAMSGRDAGGPDLGPNDRDAEKLSTRNPAAEQLRFDTWAEGNDVASRLAQYSELPPDAVHLDLASALAQAISTGREYRFAEEQYLLAALRLLTERHRWGPRFFHELTAEAATFGNGGLYDSSLNLINELGMTQRLPYGGEVSARALAVASEDLHRRVAGEGVQSAELLLAADIPLLRGAGLTAREDRIQAERDLIYAARDFEQFRRDYLFDIATDFLDLVVQRQGIINAQRQVELLRELEARQKALVESGRVPPFEAALAEQETLFARDRLNTQLESHRLAVDRFKVRVGLESDLPVMIDIDLPDLPLPRTTMDDAVVTAMQYRLDLQNERDQLGDASRAVRNAQNDLLPDLNLTGSLAIPTDETINRPGFQLDGEDFAARGGVRLSLPLDRRIEELTLRQRQIDLERARREYDEFRDQVAVSVRASIRDIDTAQFSLQLQEQNILVNRQRQESIEAAPDRATARDRSEAIDRLNRAEDARDRAKRDLQVAILRYLLNTGQLRVQGDGTLLPLPGMASLPSPPRAIEPAPAPDLAAPSDQSAPLGHVAPPDVAEQPIPSPVPVD